MNNQEEPKKTITATELKQNLGMYLDHVIDNNEVVITKNGHKAARLTPYVTDFESYLSVKEEALDYNIDGKNVSYEGFMEIAEKSELRMEYINGEIHLLSSPSIRHQQISGNLFTLFKQYLQGKKCQIFYAPFDVHLVKKGFKDPDVVQPDLLIACDLDETISDTQRYMGTPPLVVEILSPRTRRNDLAYKFNSYMLAGIQEYWIIDPDKQTIMLYSFAEYDINDFSVYRNGEIVKSVIFAELEAVTDEIFNT